MPAIYTLPAPPKVAKGREIYDSIMGQIEPELVSSVIPTLKQKYAQEKPEEWNLRKKRYNAAFQKFHEMYKIYLDDLDARIQRYHRTVIHGIETTSRQSEESKLDDLAASFFSLSS